MWTATAWDDSDWDGARARGWTVMGRLRERQQAAIREPANLLVANEWERYPEVREGIPWWRRWRTRPPRPGALSPLASGSMLAQGAPGSYQQAIKVRWSGPTVLAFLFAPPDSDPMRMLDARGDYFDQRTGDTWDLFFPGYYRSAEDRSLEKRAGARPVGTAYADNWYYNAKDFNQMREHVEQSSGRRWQYSGGADLVLISGWLIEGEEPSIDWASTLSGQLIEPAARNQFLDLGGVVERISRDLELGTEDAAYGVSEVVGPHPPPQSTVVRDLLANAAAGIASALGAKALGVG